MLSQSSSFEKKRRHYFLFLFFFRHALYNVTLTTVTVLRESKHISFVSLAYSFLKLSDLSGNRT